LVSAFCEVEMNIELEALSQMLFDFSPYVFLFMLSFILFSFVFRVLIHSGIFSLFDSDLPGCGSKREVNPCHFMPQHNMCHCSICMPNWYKSSEIPKIYQLIAEAQLLEHEYPMNLDCIILFRGNWICNEGNDLPF